MFSGFDIVEIFLTKLTVIREWFVLRFHGITHSVKNNALKRHLIEILTKNQQSWFHNEIYIESLIFILLGKIKFKLIRLIPNIGFIWHQINHIIFHLDQTHDFDLENIIYIELRVQSLQLLEHVIIFIFFTEFKIFRWKFRAFFVQTFHTNPVHIFGAEFAEFLTNRVKRVKNAVSFAIDTRPLLIHHIPENIAILTTFVVKHRVIPAICVKHKPGCSLHNIELI